MKKLPLICILSSVFCIWASFAYTSTDLSNANYLGDQNIIVKQTVASKYNLDSKILRQEVISMALKIKWITLPEDYKCKKYFADATQNNWECRAIELAADNGIITRNNKYANPGKYVTRSEALAMIMKAGGIEIGMGGYAGYNYYFDEFKSRFKFGATWQTQIFYDYIRWTLNDDSLLEINPRASELAKRSEVFEFAKNIIAPSMEEIYPFVNLQMYLDNKRNKVFYSNEDIGVQANTKYLFSRGYSLNTHQTWYVSSPSRLWAVEEINIFCEVPSQDRCGTISILPQRNKYTLIADEKTVTVELSSWDKYIVIYDKPIQIIDTENFFDFLGMPYWV